MSIYVQGNTNRMWHELRPDRKNTYCSWFGKGGLEEPHTLVYGEFTNTIPDNGILCGSCDRAKNKQAKVTRTKQFYRQYVPFTFQCVEHVTQCLLDAFDAHKFRFPVVVDTQKDPAHRRGTEQQYPFVIGVHEDDADFFRQDSRAEEQDKTAIPSWRYTRSVGLYPTQEPKREPVVLELTTLGTI